MQPLDFTNIRIETERLTLRSVRPGAGAVMFPSVDRDLTAYWINWDGWADVAEAEKDVTDSIRRSGEDINIDLLGFRKEDGEFVGRCSLVPYFLYAREYEIDIWIGHTMQGKGYATEMLAAFIPWLREHIELGFVIYSVTDGNAPSDAIRRKYDFPLHRTDMAEKRGEQKLVRDYRVDLR